MKARRLSLILTAMLSCSTVLVGCSIFTPTYQLGLIESRATTINIQQLMRPKICVDGKWYHLKKDPSGNAILPTGQTITLQNIFFEEKTDAYQDIFFSCKTALSFTPEPSQTYYVNFDIRDTECVMEIFAEDPSSLIGIKAIPTQEGAC